jgi:cysteine desulfurase
MAAVLYLDHAATTPLRPEVEAAMAEAGREGFANPSSQHAAGRRARQLLEEARERILTAIGCRTTGSHRHRLVFTSGATEANRMAVMGMGRSPSGAVAISARDHASLRTAAAALAAGPGWSGAELPLDQHGRTDPKAVAAWLETTPSLPRRILCTTLVCGQTGVGEPPPVAAGQSCLVHADATQAVPFTDLSVPELRVATLAFAPHKFGGPRGIGGLVIRGDVDLEPLQPGPQETGMRGGTQPVSLAVGFATALELACAERAEVVVRLITLRERFEAGVLAAAARRGINAVVIGDSADRSPQITTISFPGRDRQAIVMAADLAGLCCATGTACASGSSEPAPALAAMRLSEPIARGAVRFSMGRSTTTGDVDQAIKVLEHVLS